MTSTNLKVIPLDRLHDHPLNAHVVGERERKKIQSNIRRTGHYPALVVRELTDASEYWAGEPGHYQILDGHQRRLIFMALTEEGHTEFAQVTVDDWSPLTDEESLIALATLNSWGDNVPRKRAELLHAITKFAKANDAAAILPESERQIADSLKLLQQPIADIDRLIREAERPDEIELAFVVGGSQKGALARFIAGAQLFAIYYGAEMMEAKVREGGDQGKIAVLTFRITNAAKSTIEEALKRASASLAPGIKNKRGQALEEIASTYLAQTIEEEAHVPIKQVERRRRQKAPAPRPELVEGPAEVGVA